MTFDDDFVRIPLPAGNANIRCKTIGVEWPPPERLLIAMPEGSVLTFVRESFSVITDEQRSDMTHVCRGAQYQPIGAVQP